MTLMQLLVSLWVLVVVGLTPAPVAAQPAPDELALRLAPSVVPIQLDTGAEILDRVCSGVVLSPITVLTAAHCLRTVTDWHLLWVANIPVRQVGEVQKDLVVLWLEDPLSGGLPLPVRQDTLRLGESVLALGFAFGDPTLTVLTGTVAHPAPYREDAEHPLFKAAAWFDLHLMPGMSGGPIVDAHGRLVSINLGIASLPAGLAWGVTLPNLRAVIRHPR